MNADALSTMSLPQPRHISSTKMFWYGRGWDMRPGSHLLSFRHFLHGGGLAIVMKDCKLGSNHSDMRLKTLGAVPVFSVSLSEKVWFRYFPVLLRVCLESHLSTRFSTIPGFTTQVSASRLHACICSLLIFGRCSLNKIKKLDVVYPARNGVPSKVKSITAASPSMKSFWLCSNVVLFKVG